MVTPPLAKYSVAWKFKGGSWSQSNRLYDTVKQARQALNFLREQHPTDLLESAFVTLVRRLD